jgi:hypothetical protein
MVEGSYRNRLNRSGKEKEYEKRAFTRCLIGIAIVSTGTHAQDATVLINQAAVTVAGGFLYHITQPGSYKLIGHLKITNSGTPVAPAFAFSVESSNVILDLNGFLISGPGAEAGSGAGVYVSEYRNITVKNGAISGFQLGVAITASSGVIENIQATNNHFGIRVEGLVVTHCAASYNSVGMLLTSSTAVQSVVIGNSVAGIIMENSSVMGNTINSNKVGLAELWDNVPQINLAGSNVLSGNGYGTWPKGSDFILAMTVSGQLGGGTITSQGNNICSSSQKLC